MPGFPKEIFRESAVAEAFLCSVCMLVFRDAVQSPCGHRYCESCIKEKINKESVSDRRCPVCPENSPEGILVTDEIYPDFVARKELRRTPVRCINEGCNWNGEFQEYRQEHEASCPFEKIKCLKSGCGKSVRRGYLSHHLEKECPMRLTECKNCKKQLPYKDAKKHASECPEAPVACSSCNKRVARSQMDRHLNPDTGDCTKRKTKCIFYQLGCNVKVVASGMEEHLSKNIVNHNQMLVNALNKCNGRSQDGGAGVYENSQEEMIKMKFFADPSSLDIERLAEKLKVYMSIDIEGPRELKFKKGASGSLDAKALERELGKLGREVTKLKGDVEKKLVAKDLDEQLKTINAMIAVLDHRTETFQQVLAVLSNELEVLHSKTMALEKQNSYLKEFTEKQEKRLYSQDQMLTLKNIALAEQELRIQALEAASFDGVLLWRISEMKRRRQDAIAGKTTSFYSPVFYTSRHGYKLSARVYLNGDGLGKQTHMSLFFVVMQGRHDALLPWPFQQKVTFMLLDQNNGNHVVDAFRPDATSSSFKRPTNDMNIASGCPLFVTQEMLYTRDNYIKDDTMFIKVVIDNSTLEKL